MRTSDLKKENWVHDTLTTTTLECRSNSTSIEILGLTAMLARSSRHGDNQFQTTAISAPDFFREFAKHFFPFPLSFLSAPVSREYIVL